MAALPGLPLRPSLPQSDSHTQTIPRHATTKNTRKPEFTRSTTFAPPKATSPQDRPPRRTASLHQEQSVTWTGPSDALLGYSLEEIEQSEEWWLEHIHPDDVETILHTLSQHLKPYPERQQCSEARLWSSDYRFRRKDGTHVLVSEKGVTTRDEAGYPIGLSSVIFDKELQRKNRIAHKKQMEAHNYLSVVAENTPSGIFMMDSMGYVIFMNHAAEQITGFKLEELFDYTFHASCHSCRRDGSPYPLPDCPVFRAQQNGNVVKNEAEVFVHKDGHFYDIVFSVSSVGDFGSSGSVIEFRDVTEQRKMEQERMDALMVNQQTALMLRSTEAHKEQMASFVSFICHELRNPLQGVTSSSEFLSECMSTMTEQIVSLKRDLNQSTVDGTAGARIQGDLTLENGSSEDRTFSTELIVKKTLGSLESLVENAQQLIANIQTCADHQALVINNTLDLSRLEAGKSEPVLEIIDVLALGRTAITMMTAKARAKSIRLILSDDGRPPLYLNADATMLTQVVLNLISNSVKFVSNGGEIILDLYISTNDDVPRDGVPTVTLHGSVTDNGIGMTPVEKARLFQRFSQGNKKVAQLYGGSGLGLLISKELVSIMGGSISVESTKGAGSVFSFTTQHTVPDEEELHRFLGLGVSNDGTLNEEPSSDAILDTSSGTAAPLFVSCGVDDMMRYLPAPVAPPPQPAPKFKLVGVAEDNPINLNFLSKVLTSLGYEHVLCTNGEEMLTKFLEPGSKIDVMILDMSMPIMDGLECTRLIRETESTRALASRRGGIATNKTKLDERDLERLSEQRANPPTPPPPGALLSLNGIPIIALSGNALTEQVAEAFESGISDYLLKPTKKVDLLKTLRYWEEIVHAGKEHIPMRESARTIKKSVSVRTARASSLGS